MNGENFKNNKGEVPYGRTMTRQVSMHTLIRFNELRLNAKLCDASIVLDNGDTFPIHRSVLSGSCDYFRKLFNSSSCEGDYTKIAVKSIDSPTMELILQYIYMRQMDINYNNVLDVMRAANYLCIKGLEQLCHEFLVEFLGPDNCVDLLQFAEYVIEIIDLGPSRCHYYFEALREESYKYIVRNFKTIAEKTDKLMKLKQRELEKIIRDEQLNVKYEEDVWDVLMKWVDKDPENRKDDIESLLPNIRFGLMDYDYFIYNVREHHNIQNCAYFSPYLMETYRFYHTLLDPISSKIARPRYPFEVLFAIGGWSDGNPTAAVETYDTKSDSWTRICDEDSYGPRAYHGTVVVNHYIYIIGGFNGLEYFNSCRKFDTVSKMWEEVAPMNCKRCYVSVVLMDGSIYAMGGSDGHQRLRSAEKYDFERNQWTIIAPMNFQRSDACSSVLNNKLYITGGFNGQECMNTVETYDANSNKWTLIAPMQNRRSGLSCIAYHNYLYVLGGFNGQIRMNSGEKFDPVTNRWFPVTGMYIPRSNFAIEVLDDMIFVAGGYNGQTTIARVEYYNDNTDKWFNAQSMNISRSALSVCIIKDLPDIKYYMPLDKNRLCEEARSRIDRYSRGHNNSSYVGHGNDERIPLSYHNLNAITYDDTVYFDDEVTDVYQGES